MFFRKYGIVINMKDEIEKKPKRDVVGIAYYGEAFTYFMKVGELHNFISKYKDFYYTEKIKDNKTGIIKIVHDFNDMISPDQFFPHTKQLRNWAHKWDRDILEKKGMKLETAITEKHIPQVIKTRGETGLVVPEGDELEAGTKTLAGELINDAFTMLKEDQNLEEVYSSDELIKRRSYILNVMSHVTNLVFKKQELMLKANAEKRETANFLINIVREATAGKVSSEDISLLKGSYQKNEREPILQN